MDFQGQGLAISGETEALPVMDSFTKTVFVLPLQDRTAPTFIPPLLDAIWFTRGSPEVIHSDAAPELLSALLTAVLEATGTQDTTHNYLWAQRTEQRGDRELMAVLEPLHEASIPHGVPELALFLSAHLFRPQLGLP
jgi:hypothetical protein